MKTWERGDVELYGSLSRIGVVELNNGQGVKSRNGEGEQAKQGLSRCNCNSRPVLDMLEQNRLEGVQHLRKRDSDLE